VGCPQIRVVRNNTRKEFALVQGQEKKYYAKKGQLRVPRDLLKKR